MSNTDYLYKQLIKINNKYESTSFVDIDFIDLFSIRTIDKSNIKKMITNKYYSLALKYHPDKYINSDELSIDINNITIIIEEIRSGQFLSFITDIYKILIKMISEDKDNLIRIIEGDNISTINYGGDHASLKQHFNNKLSIKIDQNQINNLKEIIIDNKIDDKELQKLIDEENIKREKLKIDNIFIEEDIKSEGFKDIFNNRFETTITNTNTNTNTEILPYNELNTNLKLVSNRLSTSISDITEAFEPIQINRQMKSEIISYEELLSRREQDSNNFKVAKNLKKESIELDFVID
jgi:hypothetical protein